MVLTRYKKKCCLECLIKWKKLRALSVIKFYTNQYVSCIDPISLERIRKKIDIIRNKCLIRYDVVHLYNYIMNSGDLKDPISRTMYDSCELMRISNLMNFTPRYLINMQNELIKKRRDEMELRSLCSAFESEINENISRLCEDEHISFSYDFVPITIQAFENYKSLDPNNCKLFLQCTLDRLHLYPIPNIRLRLNIYNFLRVLIGYLS